MRTYDLLADILMPVMFFSGRVQLTGMLSEREREREFAPRDGAESKPQGGRTEGEGSTKRTEYSY
jgi:hypothetical protein